MLPNNNKTFILYCDIVVYYDKGLTHQMKLKFTLEDVSRVDNVQWSTPGNLLKPQ